MARATVVEIASPTPKVILRCGRLQDDTPHSLIRAGRVSESVRTRSDVQHAPTRPVSGLVHTRLDNKLVGTTLKAKFVPHDFTGRFHSSRIAAGVAPNRPPKSATTIWRAEIVPRNFTQTIWTAGGQDEPWLEIADQIAGLTLSVTPDERSARSPARASHAWPTVD